MNVTTERNNSTKLLQQIRNKKKVCKQISKIKQKKYLENQKIYLVQWKDGSSSWMPFKKLGHVYGMLADFQQNFAKKANQENWGKQKEREILSYREIQRRLQEKQEQIKRLNKKLQQTHSQCSKNRGQLQSLKQKFPPKLIKDNNMKNFEQNFKQNIQEQVQEINDIQSQWQRSDEKIGCEKQILFITDINLQTKQFTKTFIKGNQIEKNYDILKQNYLKDQQQEENQYQKKYKHTNMSVNNRKHNNIKFNFKSCEIYEVEYLRLNENKVWQVKAKWKQFKNEGFQMKSGWIPRMYARLSNPLALLAYYERVIENERS